MIHLTLIVVLFALAWGWSDGKLSEDDLESSGMWLNPKLDLHSISKQFEQDGMVQIADVLRPEAADIMFNFLDTQLADHNWAASNWIRPLNIPSTNVDIPRTEKNYEANRKQQVSKWPMDDCYSHSLFHCCFSISHTLAPLSCFTFTSWNRTSCVMKESFRFHLTEHTHKMSSITQGVCAGCVSGRMNCYLPKKLLIF